MSTMATRISDCWQRYEWLAKARERERERDIEGNGALNWNNKCISRPNKDLIMSSPGECGMEIHCAKNGPGLIRNYR